MKPKDIATKIKDILLKLANGFYYTETVEEFTANKSTSSEECSENLSLSKRKVSKHYVPPDMLAIKMLLETQGEKSDALSEMTDEQEYNNIINSLEEELQELKSKDTEIKTDKEPTEQIGLVIEEVTEPSLSIDISNLTNSELKQLLVEIINKL